MPPRARGGVQQRLQANAGRAEHEEPPETPQESELANALLELWAWADLSPQKMQAITAACVRDCRAMGLAPHPRVQRLVLFPSYTLDDLID